MWFRIFCANILVLDPVYWLICSNTLQLSILLVDCMLRGFTSWDRLFPPFDEGDNYMRLNYFYLLQAPFIKNYCLSTDSNAREWRLPCTWPRRYKLPSPVDQPEWNGGNYGEQDLHHPSTHYVRQWRSGMVLTLVSKGH